MIEKKCKIRRKYNKTKMLHLVVHENRISSCHVRFQQRRLILISLIQLVLLFLILKNLRILRIRILRILRILEFHT